MLVRRFRRAITNSRSQRLTPTVLGVSATSGPAMITTPQALTNAAAHMVDLVSGTVKRHRTDAVIIGGFGDPGVETLRDVIGMPVIGIGEAALREASSNGSRFAIATTTGQLVAQLTWMVDNLTLTSAFTGVEVTATQPLCLARFPAASRRELAAAVQRARAGGADKVIIGGGPLSSFADDLEQLFPGVIVDPVCAAARWAERLTNPILP